MKQFRNIKSFILITAVLALFASCSNFLTDSKQNTKSDNSKKSTLKLSVGDNSNARTINPIIDNSELSDFVLYKDEIAEANIIKSWETRDEMEDDSIELYSGDYTFILTANENGVTLSDDRTITLVEGDNEINFELVVTDFGNGAGDVNITLSYPEGNDLTAAVLTLVDMNDSTKEYSGTATESETESESVVSFSVEDIPAGTYRARTTIVAGLEKYVSYSEIVNVYTNHTSTGSYQCVDFVKNGEVYSLYSSEEGADYAYSSYKLIQLLSKVDTDLIKGDVLTLSINGIALTDIIGLQFNANSAAVEDNYWFYMGDGNVFEGEIKAGTYFSKTITIPIYTTATTLDKSNFYVNFASKEKLADGTTDVYFVADIQISVDKTSRVAPVTVTFDANGGSCDITSVTRYPGQTLSDITAEKNHTFYDGWCDEEGNKYEVVPESSTTLKADFKNWLLYEKKPQPNGDIWAPSIGKETLEAHPDAYVVAKYDFRDSEAKLIVTICNSTDDIPQDDRMPYNGGWKGLTDEEKITEAYVYRVADLITWANVNVSNWYGIYFTEYGSGIQPEVYLVYPENASEITDTVDKINNIFFSTITFDANGGTCDTTSVIRAYGQSISDIIPTLDNKIFAGWYDENGNKVVTVPSENITLYANWLDSCTISFNTMGGEPIESVVVTQGSWLYQDCNIDGDTITCPIECSSTQEKNSSYNSILDTPVRDGYVFLVWTLDEEYTNFLPLDQEDAVQIEEDITLYAYWYSLE